MLPESWRLEPAEGGCCHSRRPRRGLVTSFPVVGRMLHRSGGYPVDSLPREDAALYDLLANNNKSE